MEPRMRILLIEDEVKLASFIKRGLIAERYAVDVAKDGRSGLELAQAYQYDLVLLDLMLPGMDGSEVLRRIRRENSSVPVLILSARDTVQDKVANMETGADVYIRHLRNKVDTGHDSKLLRTVRGVGYTIREGAEG